MTQGIPAPVVLPTREVEELLRTLVKGLRAFQMYLPNNPIYQRAVQAVRGAFVPIWASGLTSLVLQIVETDILWEEQTVYHQPNKSDSLAWGLFKDGMRVLTLFPGVEEDEIIRFLEIVQKARTLATDAGDDLLTLLWEQDFSLVQYHFTEFIPDAGVPGLSGEGVYSQTVTDPNALAEENRGKVAEEAPPKKSGVVDVEDFDSTLYWLEEAEVRAIAEDIEREYKQDLRNNVLNIVFDILEQRNEDWARAEVLGTLESYLPHVLNAGDFKTVAQILRETRLLVRKPDLLTPNQRDRLDSLTGRLSDPNVLQQILTSVTEAQLPPSAEHLGEVFRELRPAALETSLVWLPKVPVNAPIHELLSSAADRLAETSPQEVLRLLRLPQSEALPAVIALCGRLKVQGAVPGLADTLSHESPQVRAAAVQSLDAIGTPAALSALERAVDDTDREVRIAAVTALGRRGYKAVLKRIEPVIQGKATREIDLTERMRFFEAYAMISGATALETLSALLTPGSLFRRKESAEVRACAALALGRLRSPEARDVLQKHRDDKELIVRNAVSKALREGGA
ncbi:MAG TPA: HEAT repeat domain-containing protein [Gemmatimonadales bacterium]|nr:HEAT repeat domain-containing protein [Gemmatimonadales bacterium]